MKRHSLTLPALAVASGLILAGCSAAADDLPTADLPAGSEAARVAVTYDGGIAVLDAATLETIAELPIEGFNRLGAVGDGRTVLVATVGGFQVLDTGAAVGTFDAAEPVLEDTLFDAATPGHVTPHAGFTALWDDATGNTTLFATDALLGSHGLPETEVVASENAHHGVAVRLADGTLYSTITAGDERVGVRHLAADGTELSRFEQCPGVHGEGAREDDTVIFGCEDGVIVAVDGAYTKIAAPDAFGRTGNVFPADDSDVVLGDYKNDPDAEGYVLTSFVLVDLAAATLEVVELPEGVGYTFRDLGRGADGEALILGTDGSLHVIDPLSGDILASHPVIDAWEGPTEWQDAHPGLKVLDGVAYVTDPATESVYAVDIATGEILATGTLPGAPIEIAIAG